MPSRLTVSMPDGLMSEAAVQVAADAWVEKIRGIPHMKVPTAVVSHVAHFRR
jgi:hypothetical protein